MKVLYLTNVPSPYRVEFFNLLGAECNLTVVYERRRASDRDPAWRGPTATTFTEVYLRGLSVRSDASLCPSILRYVTDRSFDVIVIGGYSTPTAMLAIAWLKLIRGTYVLNADGGFLGKDSWIVDRIKRYFIGGASHWLSTGTTTTRYLVNYGARENHIYQYPFTSLKESDLLGEALNPDLRASIRKSLGIKEDRCVLAIGRFIHLKGFDLLIRAAKDLGQDVGVYIVGGHSSEEYDDLCSSLRASNVHFKEFCPAATLRSYYQCADVFVFPTRSDVWGLVVNEAMAQGLPVITTDRCVAGIEMIEPGVNGYLIPADDVDAIVEAASRILELSEEQLQQMRVAALRTSSHFTIEAMASAHIECFKEMIEHSVSGSE